MKISLNNIDFKIIAALILLFSIGLIAIYSAGFSRGLEGLIYKQISWFTAGLLVIVLIQFVPMKNLLSLSNFFYILLLLLLISVFAFGSIRMGAKRWIEIGSLQFQPSEIGKLFLICVLSRYYSAGKIQWTDKKFLAAGFVLTLIPAFLILKQPDLGSAIIYGYIFFAVIFSAGLPYFYLFNIFSLLFFIFARAIGAQFFISALILYALFLLKFSKKITTAILLFGSSILIGITSNMVWNGLKSYQQVRLLTFLDPEKFSKDGGWQIVQSKTAVWNGKIFGMGFLNGSQTSLRFLPEGHNDFIFSVIAEEFGLIGILILLSIFSYLFYRLVKIVTKTQSRYLYLVGSGITALLIFQTVLNISIGLGLLPVTGLPLPFVSYGGSALLMNMLMVGIIMTIGKQEKII
ncbi:MAG: rod shape-determining protein RodA [Candidatus Delongbacteria bacterium]|nr:rod shape-determining protein RodA [Candidatus Delongbacteria bacterium]MCG2759971.1 rod shape-determining protein RodA [Candidatus Delongbacteria bacterium]